MRLRHGPCKKSVAAPGTEFHELPELIALLHFFLMSGMSKRLHELSASGAGL